MSLNKKLGMAGVGLALLAGGSGCTSPQPVYDTQGNIVRYEEKFDPGRTLMFIGGVASGLGGVGLANATNLEQATNALRLAQMGRAASELGNFVGRENQQASQFNNGGYLLPSLELKFAKNAYGRQTTFCEAYKNRTPFIFVCNSLTDRNGNGMTDAEDYIINNYPFGTNDNIIVGYTSWNGAGKNLDLTLTVPEGTQLHHKKTIDGNGEVDFWSLDFWVFLRNKTPGTYTLSAEVTGPFYYIHCDNLSFQIR